MSSLHKGTLLASLIMLIALSCTAKASDTLYVGYFPDGGMKAYDGSWHSFGSGLPSKLNPETIVRDAEGNLYLTTEFHGIFRCAAGGTQWKDISSPLMKRRTQLAGVNEYRRISAFCADDKNPGRLYCATKHSLYTSADAGKSWQQMKIKGHRNSYYFTSLCTADGILYAGTSFDGIFKVGTAFADMSKGAPAEYYAGTLHFHEGVSSLRSAGKNLYSGYLFGRGAFSSADRSTWQKISFALKKPLSEAVHDIAPYKNGLLVSTDDAVYEIEGNTAKPAALDADIRKACGSENPELLLVLPKNNTPQLLVRRAVSAPSVEKTGAAARKRAVYVSWPMLEK
ncbi:MAG: hypothetical protein ACRCUT_00035, partial [Spirochaetota bacterium]